MVSRTAFILRISIFKNYLLIPDWKIKNRNLIRTCNLDYYNELRGIIKEILHFKMLRANEILNDKKDDHNTQKEYKEA